MEETLSVGPESISVLVHESPGSKTACISLHGGGLSSKVSTDYLIDCFLANGIDFCTFDFSGQGSSSGRLADTSLSRRLDEAKAVSRFPGKKIRFLIGTSMGGYVAMKLTQVIDVENLILFCPAAYSTQAWNLKFGHGFTNEIRRPGSYRETDAGELCTAFGGNVLLFFGDAEEVIPPEIVDLYSQSFRSAASFRKVVLPGCPHPIHRWCLDKPALMESIRGEVSRFVNLCG